MLDFFKGISLADIILYLASGFVFLQTLYFLLHRNFGKDYKHSIVVSIIVGYLFTQVFYSIPFSVNYIFDIFCYIFILAILAWIFSFIIKTQRFNKILHFLRIDSTLNENIWDDIVERQSKEATIWLNVKCNDLYYCGQIIRIENYAKYPLILLSLYIIKDKDNNTLYDRTEDKYENVLIDTSKCSAIEITYDKDYPLKK